MNVLFTHLFHHVDKFYVCVVLHHKKAMMILTILQLGVLHTATVAARAPKARKNVAALIGGQELVLLSVVKTMKRLVTMKIIPPRSASPLLKEDVTVLKNK